MDEKNRDFSGNRRPESQPEQEKTIEFTAEEVSRLKELEKNKDREEQGLNESFLEDLGLSEAGLGAAEAAENLPRDDSLTEDILADLGLSEAGLGAAETAEDLPQDGSLPEEPPAEPVPEEPESAENPPLDDRPAEDIFADPGMAEAGPGAVPPEENQPEEKELRTAVLAELGLTEEDLGFPEQKPETPENPVCPGPEPENPLENSATLPDLFPGAEGENPLPEEEAPKEQFVSINPTVVSRPARKKKTGWHWARLTFRTLFKWVLAIILAIGILGAGLVGYLTMSEYQPSYSEEARHGGKNITMPFNGQELSILTFNTAYAGQGQDADFFLEGGGGVLPESRELVEQNLQGIRKILKESGADILFLQEVDLDSKRSFNINQWMQYEQGLGGYESRFALNHSCGYVPYPLKKFMGKIQSGLVTCSRYNIGNSTRYSLPSPTPWPERVISMKPCFTLTRIPMGTAEEKKPDIVLINLQLGFSTDEKARKDQMDQLLSIMREEYRKGNYVIAGGDFQQTFPGAKEYPLRDQENPRPEIMKRLHGGWRYIFDDSVPTRRLANQAYNPYTAQYFVTDGFIVSPNIQVTSVETLNEGFVYSTHNPVLISIKLT